MYNLVLADMGLNISTPPNADEKRVEVIVPAAVEVVAPDQNGAVRPVRTTVGLPASAKDKPKNTNRKLWIISGILAVVLFLILLVLACGLLVILFWPRLR